MKRKSPPKPMKMMEAPKAMPATKPDMGRIGNLGRYAHPPKKKK